MFREEDARIYEAMTGQPEASEDFMKEYMLWLRMSHRAGATGPLGVGAMVALARSQGVGPPDAAAKSEQNIDWRRIPKDTKVQAVVNGVKASGYFQGIAGSGTIAVLIEGDAVVREFGASRVEIAPLEIPDVPDTPKKKRGPAKCR
jgi:hypothetical protein